MGDQPVTYSCAGLQEPTVAASSLLFTFSV